MAANAQRLGARVAGPANSDSRGQQCSKGASPPAPGVPELGPAVRGRVADGTGRQHSPRSAAPRRPARSPPGCRSQVPVRPVFSSQNRRPLARLPGSQKQTEPEFNERRSASPHSPSAQPGSARGAPRPGQPRPHLPPSGGREWQPLPAAATTQRRWQRLAARCSRVQGVRVLPRVPGSGARDGARGRQLGPPRPTDRSRGAGAAGRIRGAGGACQGRERRRLPAEPGQLRRAARGVRSGQEPSWGWGGAGAGGARAALTWPPSGGRHRSSGHRAHLQPLGAPRPQLQSQLNTARPDLTSAAGPAPTRRGAPCALHPSSHSASAACLVPSPNH